MKIQRYRHDSEYSYTLGATLTFELVKCARELAERVFISTETAVSGGIGELVALCESLHIPVEQNDKAFHILSPKGNCYVIGEFRKQHKRIGHGNHILLVNPSDAGNLGTILRTAAGFGMTNIAILPPAADCYDPRTVRASMGAIFHVNIEYFESIGAYRERFPENALYAFMLTGSRPIEEAASTAAAPFSLIFGNEATGLPEEYASFARSVLIPHSHAIDSLNLPIAAGIGMYVFTRQETR